MAFIPGSLPGGYFPHPDQTEPTKEQEIRRAVDSAVFSAKWRQLEEICQYIENFPKRDELIIKFMGKLDERK